MPGCNRSCVWLEMPVRATGQSVCKGALLLPQEYTCRSSERRCMSASVLYAVTQCRARDLFFAAWCIIAVFATNPDAEMAAAIR